MNIPTATADRLSFTQPQAAICQIAKRAMDDIATRDNAYYDAIRRTDFKVAQYSNMLEYIHGTHERLGGHYIDVANMANIYDGKAAVKPDAGLVAFSPKSLLFDNGSELEADVVVFATGFRNDAKEMTAELCGEEVATQVEDYWGIDTEGEIRAPTSLLDVSFGAKAG